MRKVHKIDIKEELITVQDNLKYFELIERTTKLPHNKILYKIIELNYPQFPEPIYYGIKQDDLFNHILQIGNDELNKIKGEEYIKGNQRGYLSGYDYGRFKERHDIKQLSWWKRLFKKF
jgi:hypothetical protein